MRRVLLILLLACWCKGEARAVDAPLSNAWSLRVWEVTEGLPHNTISGITRTPDGYLWLATWGGLTRFDGVNFRVFAKGQTPGLEANYVRAVYAAADGAVWAGLERGGVSRGLGGHFETVAAMAGLEEPVSWTSSFAGDAAGAVWFGLAPDERVVRVAGGKRESFGRAEGLPPGGDAFVHSDNAGRIWVATKAGCAVLDHGRFQIIDAAGGNRVVLTPAGDGRMWVARGEDLLKYAADGTSERMADLSWLGGAAEVTTLLEEPDGGLWIGTRLDGLLHCQDGEFVRVATSHAAIMALAADSEGNVWAGTGGGGLNRLRRSRFSLWQARHGLAGDSVFSCVEDVSGTLWMGVKDQLPVRAADGTNSAFVPVAGILPGLTSVVCPAAAGGLWLGTVTGLYRWQDGVANRLSLTSPVTSLLEDRTGTLWVATRRSELYQYTDGVFTAVPPDGGLVVPRALAEDAEGRIWVGTEGGQVFRMREDRSFAPVLLPGAGEAESIRFLLPDGPDTMWIGAKDSGLYRWKAGTVLRLPQGAGLPAEDVRAMLAGIDGALWLATGRGLYQMDAEALAAVLEGRRTHVNPVLYGSDDGLPSLDFTFGSRNAATRTRDGHLWFSTSRGALEIRPAGPLPGGPQRILIEGMTCEDVPVDLSGKMAPLLPALPGAVRIDFTLPRLAAPDRLRFRYRLAGDSPEWVMAARERYAVFSGLPPGRHDFEVTAALDGEKLETPAVLTFYVQAAWWQTPLFRMVAVLGTAGLLAWLVRFIAVRRIRATLTELEMAATLDRERARIARDMHDDIGAGLTRIALMSELAAREPEIAGRTQEQLGALANAARQVSSALDAIVWTVNPRNDNLERLIGYVADYAEEFAAATGLECRQDLPAEIPAVPLSAEVRHNLLLAVKEALSNAARHASATTLSITVILLPAGVRISIADDGSGFDPAAVRAGGNGLANLKQRLTSLGGTAAITSRAGQGTAVILELPLSLPVSS